MNVGDLLFRGDAVSRAVALVLMETLADFGVAWGRSSSVVFIENNCPTIRPKINSVQTLATRPNRLPVFLRRIQADGKYGAMWAVARSTYNALSPTGAT